MALCKRIMSDGAPCGKPIAWKSITPMPGKSPWMACDPARNPEGEILYKTVKNGKTTDGRERFVRRAVPAGPHVHRDMLAVPPAPVIEEELDGEPIDMADDAPVTTTSAFPAIPTVSTLAPTIAPVTRSKRVDKPAPDEPQIPAEALKEWQRAETIITKTDLSRLLLYGPPATGKTTFAHKRAEASGATAHSITLTPDTPGSELTGRFILRGGDVAWLDGVVTRAARESATGPVVLIINEIDQASADAMIRLYEVLDDPSLIALHLPNGETVRPNPANWRVICTTNAEPTALPAALMDRLHLSVMIGHPHPDLVASCKSIHARRLLCAVSREYSIRALLSWDRLMAQGFSEADAARIVFPSHVASSLIDVIKLAKA